MRNSEKGSILVTISWIMTILSLLAMGVGFRALLELRLSKYQLDRLKAEYVAKAGVIKAKERLSSNNKGYDTLYECGITLKIDETPEAVFGASGNTLKDGFFSVHYTHGYESEGEIRASHAYGMMDEERKVNINIDKIPSADKVTEYRRILKGLSGQFSDEIINAMIDWQDTDSFITMPGGKEDSSYAVLPYPYECKDSAFESLEELWLVEGVTDELFNEIKDYITVYSNGKINLNTASRKVLIALIGQEYGELADKIIDYRRGDDDLEPTKDDRRITTLNDIPSFMLTPDESSRLASLSNYFTFGSSNFMISSYGSVGKIKRKITCVAEKAKEAETRAQMKYYHVY